LIRTCSPLDKTISSTYWDNPIWASVHSMDSPIYVKEETF
jgi:hypothetical protein